MKRILIVGNWKMNLNTSQASILVHRLQERIKIHREIEVILAPSMLTLQPLSLQIDRRKFRLAAQNAYFVDEGPYTGEVSFTMLRDLVHYVIVGHSDRRYKFGENLDMIRDKMAASLRNDIMPILCVGETKAEHEEGEGKQVIHDQLMSALSNLTSREIKQVVVCYEPVWAISDGKDFAKHVIPTPDEVGQSVAQIRSYIAQVFSKTAAEHIRVLYGGSASPDMVYGYLSVPGVDGFLVGGASLNYESFSGIIDATRRWQRNHQETPDGQ